jgi:hypothetical protein
MWIIRGNRLVSETHALSGIMYGEGAATGMLGCGLGYMGETRNMSGFLNVVILCVLK